MTSGEILFSKLEQCAGEVCKQNNTLDYTIILGAMLAGASQALTLSAINVDSIGDTFVNEVEKKFKPIAGKK
jgi:hypothetical protein